VQLLGTRTAELWGSKKGGKKNGKSSAGGSGMKRRGYTRSRKEGGKDCTYGLLQHAEDGH